MCVYMETKLWFDKFDFADLIYVVSLFSGENVLLIPLALYFQRQHVSLHVHM